MLIRLSETALAAISKWSWITLDIANGLDVALDTAESYDGKAVMDGGSFTVLHVCKEYIFFLY